MHIINNAVIATVEQNKQLLLCIPYFEYLTVYHKKNEISLHKNSKISIIMYISMRSVATIGVSPLLLTVLFSALTQESLGQSLVPEGLLSFIPGACMQSLNEDLLPCAIENLCFSLFPTDEEIANIPDESEIESCAIIESGLCPITSRCPVCKETADDFFKCIIINNEDSALSQNVTDLITGCSLDCNSVSGDATVDPTVPATTTAPMDVTPVTEAPAPTEAPVAIDDPVSSSSGPTDIPGASESTEAPVDAGAMSIMSASTTVGIIIGGTTFVLGWSSLSL